jgi:hypothetical protein
LTVGSSIISTRPEPPTAEMKGNGEMPQSLASTALVLLGVLITLVGLMVAGNVQLIVVGLVAIVSGGVLEVAARAASSGRSQV